MDIKEQDILGEDIEGHWYYRSKARALIRYVGAERFVRILDVGAGSGFFSRLLLRESLATEALCVDPNYAREWDDEVDRKPKRFRKFCGNVEADLVLLMDVLEHVQDDAGLLMDYVKKVPSGTRFMITVPAFQFLWSAHDVFLQHKRRYTLDGLEAVVVRSGLRPMRASYYFGFVFPIAALTRLADKFLQGSRNVPKSMLRRHSWFVNGFLATLCKAEFPFVRINRIAGLSVFCLCVKP